MKSITLYGASITYDGEHLASSVDVTLEFEKPKPKVWDITPPLGWNWTADDWRIFNFFRDLDSHGGVLSGGLCDRYVLLQYNKAHPAESLIIFEDVSEFGILPKHPDFKAEYHKDGSSSLHMTFKVGNAS